MKLRHFGIITALAAAVSFAGCAGGAGPEGKAFSDPYSEKEVKLFVTNLAFTDVTLYGITNGGRIRLGRVTGKKEVVFTLPLEFSSELYLEIDYLAGPKCFTERMIVDPGDHLDLLIQAENRTWDCREA
ncbi:MAG: hypothetical protein HKO65_14070 [Gemmatimonadetes bacterium]|nr:hypothetical protein [Gemmatimonadota bacterium]NNM06212.1 hypothetical protein [Gemmatimonadota bacterium]